MIMNMLRILSTGTFLVCFSFVPITAVGEGLIILPLQPAATVEAAAEAPVQMPEKKDKKAAAVKPANKADKVKKEKLEVPPGYEDAPEVGQKANAKPKDKGKLGPVKPAPAKAAQKDNKAAAVKAAKAARAKAARGMPTPVPAAAYGGATPYRAARKPKEQPKKKDDPKKVDPQVLALEKQYRSQFNRLLIVEIAFMRRACNPSSDQRKVLVKEGKRCAADVLRKCAIAQHNMRQRRRVGRGTFTMPDPRKLLNKQLVEVAKKTLPPDKYEKYRQESERRAASRKLAIVHYMIARADDHLMLSAEQRVQLEKILTKHYQDEWEPHMPIWMSNPHLTPKIPDGRILPILNKHQRTAWRNVPNRGTYQIDLSWILSSVGTTIREKL